MCTCPEGEACYHFLGAPVAPPDDPCSCPCCEARRGSCPKRLPENWDPVCAGNGKLDCFLRRHAASWKIVCSEMLSGECACRNPHPEWCPCCGENGRDWRPPGELDRIRAQVAVERRVLGERAELVVLQSPHFYLVTDIPKLKVRTQRRQSRVVSMHELAHLYAQRAEIAYRDFVDVFGSRLDTRYRIGIYLLERESTQDVVATAYFGRPDFDFIYGFEDAHPVAGGYCLQGLALSLQKEPDDHSLHSRCSTTSATSSSIAGVWAEGARRGGPPG